MRWLRHLVAGVRALLHRRRQASDLNDELQAFVAATAEAKMAGGLGKEDAWRAAWREAGSLASVRDGVRDVSWESHLEDAWRDVRIAARSLIRTPTFTATAVCTLALGIGANSAVFSLANGLLLRPVPGADLSRVVALTRTRPERASPVLSVTPSQRRAIEAAALPDVVTTFTRDPVLGVVSRNGMAEPVVAEAVSGAYFDAFAIRPIAGRTLSASDDVDSTAGTAAVISERLCQVWFGGDATAAIGASAVMAGQTITVVGVVGRDFRGTWLPTMNSADLWLPAAAAHRFSTVQGVRSQEQDRHTFVYMAPDASVPRLTAAIETIGRSLPVEDQHPGTLAVIAAERAILFDEFARGGLLASAFFVGLSLLVFLTACANLTNLVLARATSRSGEIAIRLAMGAGRARVMRLLVTEVVLMTALAAGVALAVTYIFTWLMVAIPLPRLDLVALTFDPSPDLTVFGYGLVVAVVAMLAVGVAPAWRVAKSAPMDTLKAGGFGGGTRRGTRARGILVGVQVALSTVVLVVAGLVGRSSLAASRFDPGYDMSRGTMASLNLALHRYDEDEGQRVQARVLEAAGRIPGVDRVMLTSGLPPFSQLRLVRFSVEGGTGRPNALTRQAAVSPGLFSALGVRLLAGRDFHDADQAGAPLVAVVSEAWAERAEAGNPVGRRLQLDPQGPFIEVVGVVENLSTDPRSPDRQDPIVFLPTAQHYTPAVTVIVTSATPTRMTEPLRQALRSVDPDLAVLDVQPLAEAGWIMTHAYRVVSLVLMSLGALGIGIALLGLYGVLAFVISLRTREFGIRRALGASSGAIYWMVVRSGLVMATGGALAGGLLAAAVGRVIGQFLQPGIAPHDPATLATVAALLVASAAAGSALAARRAARVDPNVALRDL
jgi:predicted permease